MTARSHWISELRYFLLFLALAAVTRFHTFFLSVIDWDETTYALVARSILHGHLPYTEIWDNKPPILYLVFALFQGLTGDSIFSIRLIAVVFTAGSAYLIRRIVGGFWPDWRASVAGLIYLAVSLTNGGLSSNSEHIFIFLVLMAAWLMLSMPAHDDPARSRFILTGLVLGIAFQVKFFTLADTVALVAGFFLCVRPKKAHSDKVAKEFRNFILAAIAFLLPTFIILIVFRMAGLWPEYWYANITANAIRAQLTPWNFRALADSLKTQMQLHPLLWISLAVTVCGLIKPGERFPRFRTFVVIWILLDFLMIMSTRAFYHHYYLPLFPGFSILAADLLFQITRWLARLRAIYRPLLAVLVLAVVIPLSISVAAAYRFSVEYTVEKIPPRIFQLWDIPAEIVEYIRAHSTTGATVYVADYHHVVYYLLEIDPPTRYAAPPFVIGFEDLDQIAGVNRVAELHRIMARSPDFIVSARHYNLGKPDYYQALDAYLAGSYVKVTQIGPVDVLRRKGRVQ